MSVTIVREYWKYPFLAVLRIVVVTGAFLATGVFLSNQGASGQHFPTEVPPLDSTDSLIFLPAQCFEGNASLRHLIDESFSINHPLSPGNQIHGWDNFIAMLFWYIAAVLAEVTRFIVRGQDRPGWRQTFGQKFARTFPYIVRNEWAIALAFTAYLLGGIAISSWTVGSSVIFITQMRSWAKHSGWMQLTNGKSPEDDATTFGQLVPIFLCALTVFSFCQIISGEYLLCQQWVY
jgi:hypothetical protein